MSTSDTSKNGIGFIGFLTLIFITLKILGKVEWSWWWVLSPLWISAVLVAGFLLIAILLSIYLHKRG